MADDVEGIFSDCAIAFVPSDKLAPNLCHSLGTILIEHGAEIIEPRRDGTIPVERVTHIISNTIDFPQYIETQAIMIPVVTTQWITASISRRKQAQVRPFSPDPGMIFSEVIVTCADLPQMDKESILGAVMALGGQESKDASKLCTHICALSMDHPKVVAALERKWKGKIVLPHWFDDCFKLGKRIDEGPYLLPDPDILKKGADEDLDIPTNKNLIGASSATPEFLPLTSDNSSRPPVTVFQDRSILLCEDLKLTARLRNALKDIIEYGGGRLVDDVDECDTLICRYRDGDEYVRASQACKDVGNLSWLYFLIVHNEWTSPLRRLLHYPVPKGGIPGFQDKRITVSNYGGEARIYLENLIKACGAEFTRTMKTDNTHLITARNSSEKCKAAPEWGITVVNHLWIEESYAKCEMQPVNVKKYNHFPSRTNLGEIIGQTSFNESRLRDLYYPGGEHTMSPSAKRKRKILEAAEKNAYSHGPAEGVVVPEVGQKNLDVMKLDKEETPASRKNRRDAQLVTPARSRPARADKENETPMIMSSGGRSAKSKAMDKLSSIAPDIALYEKEKKRTTKPGTPFGGKKAAELMEKEKEKGSAKKQAAHKDGDDEERPAKRSRPSLPGIEMRIILTGFPRWVGNQTKEDQDRRKLRDLGIQIVSEGHPCDYLAAPHVVRTVKFLCALARGPTVISSTFIDQILDTGKIPDVSKFTLKDTEAEAKFNIDLEQSVARAKSHRGKLLRNVGIYCTDKVRNGPDSYRTIAEANGATFKIYRARSGSTIKPTTAEQDNFLPPDPVYLLSGNSAEEKQLWTRFREMAERGHMEPRIVSPDWLLDVAMAQQVRFDKKFLIDAE
ncbi:BRCT domain-containing protein [Trichoderma longibrachiatum ATCC 18648]|uniref:BRCT domain-containing protein n=1 Tax=Trichoderma longibrachiatum ATCC 18648 TaxID=983965 RepID=A0A2T4C8D1_TRILO|nr:BRCT domain-containing protein [Trichoderma longibrachiatum ATCC 18648]